MLFKKKLTVTHDRRPNPRRGRLAALAAAMMLTVGVAACEGDQATPTESAEAEAPVAADDADGDQPAAEGVELRPDGDDSSQVPLELSPPSTLSTEEVAELEAEVESLEESGAFDEGLSDEEVAEVEAEVESLEESGAFDQGLSDEEIADAEAQADALDAEDEQ